MKTARFFTVMSLLFVAPCLGVESDPYTKVEAAIKEQNRDRVNRLLVHHQESLEAVQLDQLREMAEDIAFEKKKNCMLLNNWWDLMKLTVGSAVALKACGELEAIGKEFWQAYRAFDPNKIGDHLLSLISIPIYAYIVKYAACKAYQGWKCESGRIPYELARSLAKDIKKYKKMKDESPPTTAK